MKLKLLIAFFVVINIFLFSCKTQKEEKIDEAKLVDILLDIHVAEGSLYNSSSNIKDSMSAVFMSQIFEIHRIDSVEFKKQMKYLQSDLARMKKIYEKVEQKAKTIDNQLNKKSSVKN